MFEEFVLQTLYENTLADAVRYNAEEVGKFNEAKSQWISQVEWLKAYNRESEAPPKPVPAKMMKVVLQDQKVILFFGPEFVCDPTVELPAPPPPLPSGVTDIGPYQWGEVWGCGPKDTQPNGFRVVHQGLNLMKVERKTPFGIMKYYKNIDWMG